MSDYKKWDQIYRSRPLDALPWELGRPRKVLVKAVENELIKPGKALDLCCGAGTNPIYLARKGFQVTAIDISPKAIEYAKKKAKKANVKIQFQVRNFLDLPFEDEEFDFVFDMGCFHHVRIKDRETFIKGVHRVLKKERPYLMVCFSYKNGSAWNHFTKEEIEVIFSDYFHIKNIEHISSVEGDGFIRYFWTVFMKKL